MTPWDFAAAHPVAAIALMLATGWAGSRVVVAVGQAVAIVLSRGR